MAANDTPESGLNDPRCFAPATQRNRQPILEVLSRILPGSGTVLEIGSGTGEHAVWFAQHLRPLIWQPSDPDPQMRRSTAAHAAMSGCATLRSPIEIDATAAVWPIDKAVAVVSINMIHIAPWAAAAGLIAGAARTLRDDGVLFLYGPFRREGRHTATSNEAFDESLRRQNCDWGVRDLEAVVDLAEPRGLRLDETVEMPANNLSVIFRMRKSEVASD